MLLTTIVMVNVYRKASINAENQFRFLREMVATVPDIQPVNEDDTPEAQSATSTNSVTNNRANKRTVSRCPSSVNTKSRGRSRKSGINRPRVAISQEESEEEGEEEDIEETDEEDGCEAATATSSVGVTVDSAVEEGVRPALIIMDQVPLPVVDDDYDNV